ncbi:MAG: hypothetical protein ACHQ17_09040 [Polyangia bacterium]
MRRAWFIAALLAAGSALLTVAGCPAAHDSYPTTACKTDKDCYLGEICSDKVCMLPAPDLSTDMHFFVFDLAKPADLDDGGAGGDQ